MAIRQSTSKGSGARNRLRGRAVGLRTSDGGIALNGNPSQLEEELARQLARLAQAESILGCLRVALLYEEDRGRTSDPDYARTAGIALKLIREVADTLDSTSVKSLIEALQAAPATKTPYASKRRTR